MTEAPTIHAAIGRALDAYDGLAALGEEIDDEWSYIQDLIGAWRERFEAAIDTHGAGPIDPATDAAIDRAIDEIARIEDPHRAIDWLSTFPQVVLIALGEEP